MKLDNAFLIHESDKFNQMIKYLRNELIEEYKFKPESIITVQVKPEEVIRIELKIKNTAEDPYFCEKSFLLQRDVTKKATSLKISNIIIIIILFLCCYIKDPP